jgi:tetratricopeptide (TPR) repeat protein
VDDQLDGRARSWLQHFAIPTTTREAAEEALGALATYPLLSRADRDYAQDAAIGRVYGLAGRDADALPYAERAAHSCYALDDLVQFHRAELDLGDLYAHSGSVDRACATYQAVINQWPARSGAVTSRRAAERMARLCNGPAASREE